MAPDVAWHTCISCGCSCHCLLLLRQVIKNFFELWYWDTKPNLVRRLMRLLLTRQLMDAMHPCGQTYGQVGGVVCS